MQELPTVVNDHYSFLRWLMQRVEKYPRGYRFTLGDRSVELALEILERLIEAVYTRARSEPLLAANLGLEKLRFMVRLAKDEQCISVKQYEFASKSINDIGKQIGGWRKQAGA